ncbi:tetratricopeptide repeat-containing diguanylate cyclase [uncultured Pseudoteredinibacter sp.]|uniref:tetratricopeptide repeat-containing diguanylate cyclase n=1 Tax=uncultured Pseudoteredinibacter sp. TaxID=1641701 RepID=UPI002634EC72|nr:tetratricopeptide repeat-containing diguanylate cyclase [uncultured Pseudoteredinibacter sp.]
MRNKNKAWLLLISMFAATIISGAPQLWAEGLPDLLSKIEKERFLMKSDLQERQKLEAYIEQLPSYSLAIQGEFYLYYQNALVRTGKLQESIDARRKLLAIHEQSPVSPSFLRYSKMLLGLAYANLSKGDQSKPWLIEVIQDAEATGDYQIAFHSALILGDVYSGEKNFSQAFASYQKAQAMLSEKMLPNNKKQQGYAWQAEMNYRTGYVYRHMWRDADAADFFKRALEFDRLTGNARNIKYDLNQIADAYYRLGNFEQAIVYYKQLEESLQQSKTADKGRHLDFASSMVNFFVKQNRLDSAKIYLEKAQKVFSLVQSTSIRIRYFLARSNYSLLSGDFKAVLENCQAIEAELTEKSWAEYGSEMLRLRAEAYYGLGEYQQSAELFERVHQLYLERSDHVRLMTAEVERARFDFEAETLKVERLMQDNQFKELELKSEKDKFRVSVLIIVLALLLILSLVAMMVIALRNEKKLKFLAEYDALTSVPNRRSIIAFGEQLSDAGGQFSVLLIDVDHFKNINDSFGHAQGDRVLQYIALVASSFCSESVRFGRLGGEEFLFVVNSDAENVALSLACSFSDKLKEKVVGGIKCPTVSVGVAFRSELSLSFGKLLEQADEALYQAKSNGRDCVKQYCASEAKQLFDQQSNSTAV